MMIKAVLLDLDDTLLGNPTERFVRDYLAALAQFLTDRLGIENIMASILASTQAVITSQDPRRTNQEVFYATLASVMPLDRELFDRAVEAFYREAYPALQTITQRRPIARRLIEWLIVHGYRLVVATNPLFPLVAVAQRLDWAGIPTGEFPFQLVTTLENMHFTKPHPEYYEEILARVGLQADEAILVGDDWKNDIIPAWQAGLNTFWISNDGTRPNPVQPVQPDSFGTLDHFAWLVQDQNWLDTLAPRPLEPSHICPRLTGNLAGLLGIVSEIPPHVWHMRPDAEEWTPIEVLCHLRDSERTVQRPRLETILCEDNPFLSQPAAPPATQVCPESARQVALAFAAERQQTLDFLAALPAEAWNRPARHYIFGPTTLVEMANFTATHDRLHIEQLCQTVGKCV
jgi:FMN phosphatase YigB (HAD superfamily)